MRLKFVPNHLYTKLIYVSDKTYNQTYDVDPVIKLILDVLKVDYLVVLEDIIRVCRSKDVQQIIVKKGIKIEDLDEEAKNKLKTDLSIREEQMILNNSFHTIVLLDDCQNMFENKNIHNIK